MKLKAIERLCKAEKRIRLLSAPGELQWMGDGCAFYLLEGLPLLDEDAVFTIFDVPEPKRGKYSFFHDRELIGGICWRDVDPKGERPMDAFSMTMNMGGVTLRLLRSSDGRLVFINNKYISPFDDGEVELFLRTSAKGQPYVAVKRGMILCGVISPFTALSEDFIESLGEIYNKAAVAYAEDRERDEQYSI